MRDVTVETMIAHAQRSVRRYGFAGTATRVVALAGRSISHALYLQERHVWYALDLTAPRASVDLPDGYALSRARAADLPLLEQLPTIGGHEAAQRHRAGADLWLVRAGERPAFACWVFRDRTPVLAAPRGWLPLPAATVCLEDSVTAPAHRGRGLAAGAWSAIADHLARDGVTTVITKVAEDNTPSRRAVEKIGFEPTALMTLTRLALRSHVDVYPYRDNALFAFLAALLTR
ncbi:MAG: GNAT family N-acetyltransferase [Acidobacteria bacterium]|nr:GNAT family N-acetyltransferase [Acidobacteriota bacterium]